MTFDLRVDVLFIVTVSRSR